MPASNQAKKSRPPRTERTFDALPDTVDFRDTIFIPTLVRVAAVSDLAGYRAYGIPVLDQGREGACTGFGLATVANYLLRVRGQNPTADEVSAWMLYTMAKRYDEWPGEDYDGSSARGAMKGWFKHGLCALALWKERDPDPQLGPKRSADAIKRPLGAYFRVNHKDLVAMHSAISEVGVLFATATVHEGWQQVREGDKGIRYRQGSVGGHAFAIVGYDQSGFWIQNSWGPTWGDGGLANLSYADWLANGKDVWVAALGAPIDLGPPVAVATMRAGAPRSYESQVYADLRPHVIMSKNDGILDDKGTYGLTVDGLRTLVTNRMPATMSGWQTNRVLLYAHGGLVPMDSAIQTVANNLGPLLKNQVYPLSFIWRSDAWNTIRNILQDAMGRRRDEGLLDKTKDFMLDRVDDMLEVVARNLGGKALWDEMKENAQRATTKAKGAARLAVDHLIELHAAGSLDEIHLVGHSAGSIFLAPVAERLAAGNVKIKSLSLWAPACTIGVFEKFYEPLIKRGTIEAFDLYTLDDATEQDDDCADIYHKSLLYLVSNAFEAWPHIPGIKSGVPLLGLARDASAIPKTFWKADTRRWSLSPGSVSHARHHGDFDNDEATLRSTLKRIVGTTPVRPTLELASADMVQSRDARSQYRQKLDAALRR
ncbi:peptidase C1A papain family protein (plasmid) [Rhizobium gallicum]|uniref:Peptidase C1A papain family protein n=1 Tax=Rhizobium gallicum TaxID=56730 RepID=A0A1L5NWE9_9HYPH|nr:C1 family peptidase [Rhizobium gallicum]APO72214.1 peptidase C1A papain family protein [Rhizobium gallicum]